MPLSVEIVSCSKPQEKRKLHMLFIIREDGQNKNN